MIKKKLLTISIVMFMFFCLPGGELYPQKLSKEKLNRVMEQYDYANWGPGTGKTIPGVKLSEISRLNNKSNMKQVWNRDNISMGKIEGAPFSAIRQRWKSEEGSSHLDVAVVVCPTFDSAKKFLIARYANSSLGNVPIRPTGRSQGIDIGNVCFVSKANQEGKLSTIDLIRDNVIIMIRAEGSFKAELEALAREMDDRLMQQVPVNEYSQLQEIPTIINFSSEKAIIKLGESVPLHLDLKKPEHMELRYSWKMSGGGVDKTPDGNFSYYGGEVGKHTLTLTVLNEVGLQYSKTLEIEVVR